MLKVRLTFAPDENETFCDSLLRSWLMKTSTIAMSQGNYAHSVYDSLNYLCVVSSQMITQFHVYWIKIVLTIDIELLL